MALSIRRGFVADLMSMQEFAFSLSYFHSRMLAGNHLLHPVLLSLTSASPVGMWFEYLSHMLPLGAGKSTEGLCVFLFLSVAKQQ